MTRFVPFIAALFLGCVTELPSPAHDSCGGGGSGPDETGTFVVRPLPDADLSAVPALVRLRVVGAEDPSAFVLVAGEVGSAHLSQLARNDVSRALSERIVETVRFSDAHGVVLAPVSRLPAGPYAVASGNPKGAVQFDVVDDGRGLDFVFPPQGTYGERLFGLWCGDSDIAGGLDRPGLLVPTSREPEVTLGLSQTHGFASCLTLRAPASDAQELPPQAIDAGGQTHWLEPQPLARGIVPPRSEEPCPAGTRTVGPGCFEVQDDRIQLWPRDAWHLWSIKSDNAALASPLAPPLWVRETSRFTRRGLTPNASHELTIAWFDASGHPNSESFTVFTDAPSAHLIITEVMANPIGAEPQQEWVELYNDGSASADLSHYRLVDPAGGEALPPVMLPPARYALLVSEGYDPDSFYDASPPPDTLVVTVAELATNGLSNGGEPLALERDGQVISRFPPSPKPKAGESVVRRTIDTNVHDPEGFYRTAEPSPGAPPSHGRR